MILDVVQYLPYIVVCAVVVIVCIILLCIIFAPRKNKKQEQDATVEEVKIVDASTDAEPTTKAHKSD